MAITTRLTIEDFERLPDALAYYHELVDGELVDVSGNTPRHNSLRDLLVELLRPYVAQRRLGKIISEQEFAFGENAHGPDVSFLRPDKALLVDNDRRVQLFVPDLAVEIVSRHDSFESLMGKAARYRPCGTSEVWVLAPKTRQAFVQSEERQTILGEDQPFESSLIPGFSILLGDLFDRA